MFNTDNVIQDDNYYYFFRALNMGDLSDIESGITVNNGSIEMIRTDRERYTGISKYSSDDTLSLEQIYDHIKNHHRYDTNCISLSSNACAVIDYGRRYYKDQYVMIRIPKNELGYSVVNAGLYMINEINGKIQELINNNELSEIEKYYISRIDEAKAQDELNVIIEELEKSNIDNFDKGIIYDITNTIHYSALNTQENLEKNKAVLKLDVIRRNILPNATNKNLIITIGGAFSSLEYIHYNSITGDKITRVNKKIVDIFSLIQQLPSSSLLEELKLELVNNINRQDINNYEFNDYNLNLEDNYTLDNMYELTKGTIDYNTSINMYKKSFYLAKSKLRMKDTLNLLKQITNNNPKYNDIYKIIETSTYGIEPEIISRKTSNNINISESISLDFNPSEKELFAFLNRLNNQDLEFILRNPTKTFNYYLNHFNIEKINYTKDEYFANAIIDLFDWKSLNIISFSSKQRQQIIDKLIENNVVDVYYSLKEKGVKEEKIANVLLTSIIRKKDLNKININETFSVEELEEFLGYYKVKDSNLKLRPYQAKAYNNGNELLKYHNFYAAIMPTGSGKSFLSLAKMLENRNASMLYLAPNDIILNQLEDYIIKYIYGTKGTLTKNKKQIIKEVFPNLKLCTYQALLSENQDKIINDTYDLIFLDELHRSGASEWYSKVKKLMNNQPKTTKVIGITATPQRNDDENLNMADEWARYFGYSDEEIELHKHLAINMDIEQAIKLGYVVNPKVVFCEYNLFSPGGVLYNLHERINLIKDEGIRNRSIEEFKRLRKIIEKSHGISQIIGENLKLGDRCLVFLPVVNKDGKPIEDEDGNIIDSRIYGDEVIEKYKNLLISYLQEYYHLSKDEISDMVEFHSMLGKYGKGKNQYELEKFEQKNSKKIKFMLLMNKGNEGMHAECEREIHFRPTESSNLFLQLLGRVEYGILPNQIILDEDRPTVIDPVGNFFVYALNKEKHMVDDLDKLKIVIDWININGIIPRIDSIDKVEFMHALTLRNIKNKYIKYLTIEDKDKISTKAQEILKLGSMIDLWYIEYPEVIISKDGSKRIKNEDDTFFELTGVLQDLCELSKEVDSNLYMSFEEKVQELINSINELHRLPNLSNSKQKNPERVFRNGTDQRNFYVHLHYDVSNIIKKINGGIILSEEEERKFSSFKKIEEVLSKYIESDLEKKKILINTIQEIHRLPKRSDCNKGNPEKQFKDGTDLRSFYDYLKYKTGLIIKKRVQGIDLTDKEKEILKDYEEINEVLNQYVISISNDEKREELIKTIKKLHRLPRQKQISGVSEEIFRNGTDQRIYYDRLKMDVKKFQQMIDEGIQLSTEQQQKLRDYEEISEVLNQYIVKVSDQEKKEELIKSIIELNRLPKNLNNNKGKPERVFRNGTDQRGYYDKLQQNAKKFQQMIDEGVQLSTDQQQKLRDYEEVNEVLNQYVITISIDEKIEELIKTIKELRRLPKIKKSNNNISEKVFKDGTDMRSYYNELKKSVKKIKEKELNGILITEDEHQKVKYLEEIERVLLYYPSKNSLNQNMIIELCNQYGIDSKINKSILDKSYYEVYTKLMYLIDNNIPIINNDGILCDIFYMADINMQLKYGVSIDELVDKYIINGKRL